MSYIDAFILPVPTEGKEAYARKAARVAAALQAHGAIQVVECWGEDRPDFSNAAQVARDENVVLSWIVWPSKEVRDAGHAAVQADHGLQLDDPLFNPSRMLWSGFTPLFHTQGVTHA